MTDNLNDGGLGTPVRVAGPVAREGVQTGDGRIWPEGSNYWMEDAPGRFGVLRWVEKDRGLHDDAVAVGVIVSMERIEMDVWAEFLIWPGAGNGAGQRVIDGMNTSPPLYGGVSIDGDDWAVTVIDTTMSQAEGDEQAEEMVAMLAAAGDGLPDEDRLVLFKDEAGEIVERFDRMRIRSVTLVDIPAHQTGFVRPVEAASTEQDPVDAQVDGPGEVTAAVTAAVEVPADTGLPVAAEGTEWDPDSAAERLAEWCAARQPDSDAPDDTEPTDACRAQGYLLSDPDTGEMVHVFVDIVDEFVVIVPAAVETLPGLLDGHEGLSDTERAEAEAAVCALYATVAETLEGFPDCPYIASDEPDEPDNGDAADAAEADEALPAAGGCGCAGTCGGCGPVLPPLVLPAVAAAQGFNPDLGMFEQPVLDGPTPIAVTDDGRVFGHIAANGVCHTGIDCGGTCGARRCQLVPRTARGYTDFHRYGATSSGLKLPVACGRITVGHGQHQNTCGCCPGMDDHACRHRSFGATVAHHDQLTPVAYGRVGEDTHGVWFAGVLAPEAAVEDVAVLDRRKVSGDWRDLAGGYELSEILALSVAEPGFPVEHRSPSTRSLVAAGRLTPPAAPAPTEDGGLRLDGVSLAEFANTVAVATAEAIQESARKKAAAEDARARVAAARDERRARSAAAARRTIRERAEARSST